MRLVERINIYVEHKDISTEDFFSALENSGRFSEMSDLDETRATQYAPPSSNEQVGTLFHAFV